MQVTTAILTALLVAITAYYAWQTRRTVNAMQAQTTQTVEEMRRARSVQVLPKLVPTLFLRAPGLGFLRIINAGPGPALNADLEFWLGPNGERHAWKSPLVVPGETHDFIPTLPGSDEIARLDELTGRYATLHLEGSCTDALGDVHTIREQADLRETWELIKATGELQGADHMRDIAKELEKLRKEVEEIRKQARSR